MKYLPIKTVHATTSRGSGRSHMRRQKKARQGEAMQGPRMKVEEEKMVL
jgi:hypothetical protein